LSECGWLFEPSKYPKASGMEGIISGASSTKFLDTLGSDSNASPQTKHVVVVVGGGGGGGGAMVVMVAYLE
jgi:hypothetical protein